MPMFTREDHRGYKLEFGLSRKPLLDEGSMQDSLLTVQ